MKQKEKLEKDIYFVYGSDFRTRQFLKYVDKSRLSEISGIAVKVLDENGDCHYLARALNSFSHGSDFDVIEELVETSSVSGGSAMMGTSSHWGILCENQEGINQAVDMLKACGLKPDCMEDGLYVTSSFVGNKRIKMEMGKPGKNAIPCIFFLAKFPAK